MHGGKCCLLVVFLGMGILPTVWAGERPEWPPRWPDEDGPVLTNPGEKFSAPEIVPVASLSEPDRGPAPLDQLVSSWEEPAPLAPIPEAAMPDASGENDAADTSTVPCPDRWTIPQPCFLQRMGIRMGGWLQQGITFNGQEPPDGFNGPVATNDLDSEYQMNQLWLYFNRPADNGGCGWAWGGHVDIMYGTDWRFGINHGLEDRINGLDQTYGMVIPQFYLELAYNRLSMKIGHFAGILDYEAVPGPMNPFYSHSYCYGYTVPQLVTGMLFDYRFTDQLSGQAGFHRGWMQFEDNNDRLDFMGGVKWRSEDGRLSIAYALSAGPQDDATNQDRFVYSLVAQWQVTRRFQYVLVHNLGSENRAAPGGQDAEWYGLNQYFLYTINPCWSAGMRVEWLRDDDGVRIGGPGNIPGVRAWSGRGFAGDFYEITWGLNWRPNGNWLIRPEIRWDWYEGPPGPVGLPFDGGSSDTQLTVALDAIFSF